MSLWRTSDGRIRVVLIIGLVQVISAALDLREYGVASLRWLEPLSCGIACFAAVPLEEPPRKSWPLRRQLRSPYGLLGSAFLGLSIRLCVLRVARG